jgi:hypothetical protein
LMLLSACLIAQTLKPKVLARTMTSGALNYATTDA